ncbi:MAG TPA: EF-P lysine aminoacylase EpmA [Steroidobacteraceae bacterium]|nr:EF-P lysine aminoacylase EpmA [Steroidobacteraceae bacterium]
MRASPSEWRPLATREMLQRRASLLAAVREFFASRAVLEVDTAQLVNFAVTDPQLHSAEVRWPGKDSRLRFLHTSPEYAMKRLLAAGSGDLYQLCHVFRGGERGALHNAEFMLLEWYRTGWSSQALMSELDALLRTLLGSAALGATRIVSYEQAFVEALALNPFSDSDGAIAACACAQGHEATLVQRCSRDEVLDLLMGTQIGPRLGEAGPVFVHRYPASQAALARLDPADSRVALRFELYLRGVELANGFEELTDATEQRARFLENQRSRAARGLSVPAIDEFLLAALDFGLPPCAGVALGMDRVLMLGSGARRIGEVLAFGSENA